MSPLFSVTVMPWTVSRMCDMRAALVAIQELHNSWISDDGAEEEMFCTHCRQADWYEWDYVPFPCPTRKLADEALNTN